MYTYGRAASVQPPRPLGTRVALARAHARIIYFMIILWASLREAHIRYGVASRVAADAQERVPPAWPCAFHPQTRNGRAGARPSRVAVRVPPAGRVVPNAPRRLVDKPPYQSWCFCNYLFCQ